MRTKLLWLLAAGLALAVAGCKHEEATPNGTTPKTVNGAPAPSNEATGKDFSGTYAMTDAKAKVTLLLSADKTATLTTEPAGAAANLKPSKETGTWAAEGDGVKVTLKGATGADDILFAVEGSDLVAKDYSKANWGDKGLKLTKQ